MQSSPSERVQLRHFAAQAPQVRLRELRGDDELAVAGVDTRAAVQLLDRLLDAAPCPAAELSASDRDRLLAALHRALWGDRILSSLHCPACEAMYDLSFDLSALQRELAQQAKPLRVDAPRALETQDGERYRLPSADDEEAAAALGPVAGVEQLAALLGTADAATLSLRLDALAPLLDVDLDTRCAECGQPQLARFDIQSFVLQRLLDERESVLVDLHTLASGYGWSLGEITSLPRSVRRSLASRLTDAPA